MKNETIIKEVLCHNFISDFENVTREIKTLSHDEMIKGFLGFKKAYSDLPNIFDCGDVEAVLFYAKR